MKMPFMVVNSSVDLSVYPGLREAIDAEIAKRPADFDEKVLASKKEWSKRGVRPQV